MRLFRIILFTAVAVCAQGNARKADRAFVAKCFIAGLGTTDVEFAEQFSVYRSTGKPDAGFVSVSSVLVQHVGKPSVQRQSREFSVKFSDISSSPAKLQVRFADGAFSEDYLSFEIPKKPENLSLTFDATWGGHRYYCRAWE